MLRYLAPYLAVGMIIAIASAVAYSTGTVDAGGVYGLTWVAMIVMGIGAVRWEERNSHRQ